MEEYSCKQCHSSFFRRASRGRKTPTFCSDACSRIFKASSFSPKSCIQCFVEFLPRDNVKKFCSRSCAARQNGILYPKRIRPDGKKSPNPLRVRTRAGGKYLYTCVRRKSCTQCGNDFWAHKPKLSKTNYRNVCSDECRFMAKKNSATGIKTQTYGTYLFQSGWEVEIAKYLDEHNIAWLQPKSPILYETDDGKTRRYYPDFYLPFFDVYVDPKNPYCIKQQQPKLSKVTKIITLVYGSPTFIKDEIEKLLRPAVDSNDPLQLHLRRPVS